jgi:hypothetical protein
VPKIKIDKADRLFSLWVRTRDEWKCKRCSTSYSPPTSALHCSHFIGRGKEATRYEPLNCDALCYGCHSYFSAHPSEHYIWQVERKSQETVDKLRLAGNTYKKKDRKLEALYWAQKLKEDFGI